MHNGQTSGNAYLVLNPVIKAMVVHCSSILWSKPCCHWSEGAMGLARERKDDSVTEKHTTEHLPGDILMVHIIVKRYSFAVKCTAYCLSPNSLGFFRNILYLSLVSRWQNNKLWILITYFQQDKAHNISVKGKLNCRYNISQQVHVYLYCLQCSYMQTSLLSTEKTCYTVWPSWT